MTAKGRQGPGGGNQRLLDNVVGVGSVAAHLCGKAGNARRVLAEQCLKRPGIALLGERELVGRGAFGSGHGRKVRRSGPRAQASRPWQNLLRTLN